jgi:preprotein translocase subunit SecA
MEEHRMLRSLATRFFGTANDRSLSAYGARTASVSKLVATLRPLGDAELKSAALELKSVPAGAAREEKAVAIACEASRRVLGLDPYPVQITGALVLLDGKVAEMRTGEGKTLVAGIAAFAAALDGPVHIATVNDYLARRDRLNVGAVHEFLGMTVGLIVPGIESAERRAAYACDVVYAVATEIGFDLLKDSLATDPREVLQPTRRFAIVDEVDSVFIDEARTPLIIAHPDERSPVLVASTAEVVSRLPASAFDIDEEKRTAVLTEDGLELAEAELRRDGVLEEGGHVYDAVNGGLMHRLGQAALARFVYRRDKDYVVRDGRILLVDQSTGRVLEGRQLRDGLHQAIEAHEKVEIAPESMTLASVTIQNLFRGYAKLSGMTGTAYSDAEEFEEIYHLRTVVVPPNRPNARRDDRDEIYRTEREKLAAIVAEVSEAHARRQPVLVGTPSVEKSEIVAAALAAAGYREMGIEDFRVVDAGETASLGRDERTFAVLNARNHAVEADIIAQAGLPGSITIATNMAGRGTDIRLGGDVEARLAAAGDDDETVAKIRSEAALLRDEAVAAGGLYVMGTERHENRRIDDQLRGRSGRQGEPGRSRFFLSLEDDLLRIYGGAAEIAKMAELGEGEAISHSFVDKAVSKAQKKLEGRNFGTRRELVKFDDVLEEQRKAIQSLRTDVMGTPDLSDWLGEIREEVVDAVFLKHAGIDEDPSLWRTEAMVADFEETFAVHLPVADILQTEPVSDGKGFLPYARAAVNLAYRQRAADNGPDGQNAMIRYFMLVILDMTWREHLSNVEHLRHGVGMRATANVDPLIEYRTDSMVSFESMLERWKQLTVWETMRRKVTLAEPEGQAA